MDVLLLLGFFLLSSLFVFAILLLIFAIVKYSGFFISEIGSESTPYSQVLNSLKFVFFSKISGNFSYAKIMLVAFAITSLIFMGILISGLVGA